MSRNVVMSLRVTDDEARQLRSRAASLGIDVSELLRRSAFDAGADAPECWSMAIGDGSPMIMWDEATLAVLGG